MAKASAIAAVGLAVVDLLERARPTTTWTIGLYQADDFKTRKIKTGASVYLYRVVPSSQRVPAPRPEEGGARRKPPLPLDLHYLLTPWAEAADTQHVILGWMLRAVADTPVLSSGFLNDRIQDSVFSPEEDVTLTPEPLSIQDTTNVWEVGKPAVQISATYVARLIRIDSLLEEKVGRPVQGRDFDVGGRG
jgi:hypothetical protein